MQKKRGVPGKAEQAHPQIHTPHSLNLLTPVFERWGWKDQELMASLGYKIFCLEIEKKIHRHKGWIYILWSPVQLAIVLSLKEPSAGTCLIVDKPLK